MHCSYRTGLTLALLLLALLPVVVGAMFFSRMLTATVHGEFAARAQQAGDGIHRELNRRLADLATLAGKHAADPITRRALLAGDRTQLAARLRELHACATLDLLEAGGSDGRVLARGHRPGDFGEDKSAQPVISRALAGAATADIESGVSGIALRAVAPVRAADTVAGTIMVGVLLDRTFLATYRTITGFELALYQAGRPVTATADAPPDWLPAAPAAEQAVIFNRNGREQWGRYVPLLHPDGAPVGGLLVWQDAAALFPGLPTYRSTFALMLLSGLLLAAGFALLFGRTFAAPLRALLTAMDRAASEPVPDRLPVSHWREFSELTAHFTAMLAATARAQRQALTASKLAVIGRVTAELAHEIRNPLNAMEITLRVLKDKLAGAPPECADKVDLVRGEIRRLDQTLHDFIDAGENLVLRRQRLSPVAELREVLRLMRPQIESLGLALQETLTDSPPVLLDRTRFHQAARNLVLNACQSMKPGGILAVAGGVAGTRYELRISDTGPGMTRDEQQKLFDFPFSTRNGGHGIGLPYVMRIVQAHDGEFELQSTPGQGTTVILRLPLAATA
ncbi:MAG TPA: ATP-binding protein [bacterium]|nr:ATP-binding protein [bacterium]